MIYFCNVVVVVVVVVVRPLLPKTSRFDETVRRDDETGRFGQDGSDETVTLRGHSIMAPSCDRLVSHNTTINI